MAAILKFEKPFKNERNFSLEKDGRRRKRDR